jgi:hypothetical protein
MLHSTRVALFDLPDVSWVTLAVGAACIIVVHFISLVIYRTARVTTHSAVSVTFHRPLFPVSRRHYIVSLKFIATSCSSSSPHA